METMGSTTSGPRALLAQFERNYLITADRAGATILFLHLHPGTVASPVGRVRAAGAHLPYV